VTRTINSLPILYKIAISSIIDPEERNVLDALGEVQANPGIKVAVAAREPHIGGFIVGFTERQLLRPGGAIIRSFLQQKI